MSCIYLFIYNQNDSLIDYHQYTYIVMKCVEKANNTWTKNYELVMPYGVVAVFSAENICFSLFLQLPFICLFIVKQILSSWYRRWLHCTHATCIIHTHVANMNNETGDLSSSTGTRHSLGILSFDIEQTSNCATTHMGQDIRSCRAIIRQESLSILMRWFSVLRWDWHSEL